jgi:hypothetical protein
MRYYVVGVLLALDILANAVLAGDHYTTISCRIGESIQAGGFWGRVPMPAILRNHFLGAIYETTV